LHDFAFVICVGEKNFQAQICGIGRQPSSRSNLVSLIAERAALPGLAISGADFLDEACTSFDIVDADLS
jgi:hypothetical protein